LDLLDKFDNIAKLKNSLPFEKSDPFTVVMDEMISENEAIINGKLTILAGTNNYMGMTFNDDAMQAAKDAIDKFGTGTTGSRVLNGTYNLHKELENTICDFYGMKHSMVFTTGYQANLGLISTLAGKDDYVIIDADSHASIYDGCALGNATIVRFRHNDAENLRKRLARIPEGAGKLVVIEDIYSMLGDRAPLKEILEAAKEGGAMTVVDQAHSMGFCGENGRGLAEELGVEHLCDFIVGTFSKSAGTVGGFCVSNHPKFEILRLVCRPYMFTASPSPSVVASATVALKALKGSHNKRAALWDNAKLLHAGLKNAGFDMGTPKEESPIIAVCLPEPKICTKMWEQLLDEGVYTNMALPPATPAGLNLLRVSINALHTPQQINTIIACFIAAAEKAGVKLDQAAITAAKSGKPAAAPSKVKDRYKASPWTRLKMWALKKWM